MNEQAPYAPVYVTNLGNTYVGGTISSYQPGRGIADYTAGDLWTWDGRSYVHTASMTTGMYKHVAPGGAWELPSLVVNVNDAR